MKLTRLLFSFVALGLLGTGSVVAQDSTSTGRSSAPLPSEASAQQDQRGANMQPTSVNQAPRSVVQVRRRVRSIGPGGSTVRRVIYPMIVVPQVQVTVATDEAGRPIAQPGASSRLGSSYYPYTQPTTPYNYNDGYTPYYNGLDVDSRGRRTPSVVDLRNGGSSSADSVMVADSLAAPPAVGQAPPPPPSPSAPPPPPRQEEPTVRQVERSVLETGLFRAIGVNFEFNDSQLLPEADSTLRVVAETMQKYPNLRFRIDGHTDAVGSDAYNQELSARRAEAVRDYLVSSYSISADRLATRGFGESQPIATNATATGRTLNRRVEFSVTNPGAVEEYREEIMQNGNPADQQLRESLRRVIREEIQRMQSGGGGSN